MQWFSMCRLIMLLGFIAAVQLLAPAISQAHFIWMARDGQVVKVYFGEGPEPDQAQFLKRLDGMTVYCADRTGPQSYSQKSEGNLGWFEVDSKTAASPSATWSLACDYGAFTRGETTIGLHYAAIYRQGLPGDSPSNPGNLRWELVPEQVEGAWYLVARFDGQPVSEALIVRYVADTEETVEEKTDAQGRIRLPDAPAQESARWRFRANHRAAEAGEWQGQKFATRSFYCTLIWDWNQPATAAETASTATPSQPTAASLTMVSTPSVAPTDLPALPAAITSFGAVAVGPRLYVFGGQMGAPHAYAKQWQNGHLWSLAADGSEPEWRSHGEVSGAQGLALVAYEGKLIRVGGFEARNEIGAPQDLHSLDIVQAFDLEHQRWEELPKLPEPRSSFDACVLDGQLYVVGGWQLRGSESTIWSQATWVLNLRDPQTGWRTLPGLPQTRRALAVVPFQNQIVAIGGMSESGGPAQQVFALDVAQGTWQEWPALPENEGLKGFGSSAIESHGTLIVSAASGKFWKWDAEGKAWNAASQTLEPARFFHRILAVGENRFVVLAGANMESGRFADCPIVELSGWHGPNPPSTPVPEEQSPERP